MDVNKIVKQYFDRAFFFEDFSVKEHLIAIKIENFPIDIHLQFVERFKKIFPNLIIEKLRMLNPRFLGNRCLQYLVADNPEGQRYIFLVSIFGYFSVYKISIIEHDIGFHYSSRSFINMGESSFCDEVYESCLDTQDFKWPEKHILNEKVADLSVITDYFSCNITIADALFFEGFEI